jgi:hypothetical protein
MSKTVVVSLDDILSRVAGHVSIAGVEYPVKAITAPALQLVQRIETDEPPALAELLAAAMKLCPALPGEVWESAPAELIGTILGVAQARVRQVEADLPNSSGPASQTPPAASPEG